MFTKTWRRQFSFRTLSLRQRLPILICILLMTVMIVFTLISYYSVRRVTLKGARERLVNISEQMTSMFGQNAQTMHGAYRNVTGRQEMRQYLRSGDEALKAPALSLLNRLATDSLIVFLELVDQSGRPLLVHTKDIIERSVNTDSLRRIALSEDSFIVGNFHFFDNQIYHPVKSAVTDGGVAGYVVGWRKVVTSKALLERFSKLLGDDAKIYVGNKDGSLWTNFNTVVKEPIPAKVSRKDTVLSFRNRQGEKVLATERTIANTPWVFVVEFPQEQVVAPASEFLKWMIIIGAFLNVIAIFVTWQMSRGLTKPLQDLTAAASEIASGQEQLSAKVNVNRYDEIGKLSRAFNSMLNKVARSKYELEKKVEETQQMTSRLRELSAHLQNVREEERIHIAREMHDELGQLLTGFKMDVSWLHKKIGDTTDPVVKEKLQEMMQVVNDAARFVRKIASELRPSILDDLGLVAALDWHSQEFRRRTGIEVEFNSSAEELDTPKEIATGLFRMYQESLTNVARHADARKVISELEVTEDNIQLTITDDGKGFDTRSGERKTLGLLGMRERATMLKGEFRIYSAPGKGTTIVIRVPKHQPAFTT